MSSVNPVKIGNPIPRVDGPAKVMGAAKFAAEFAVPSLAHAQIVHSTIPGGRVAAIDTGAAKHAPGVIAVMTPGNAMKLAKPERRLTVLQDDQVFYQNQPIAVV